MDALGRRRGGFGGESAMCRGRLSRVQSRRIGTYVERECLVNVGQTEE